MKVARSSVRRALPLSRRPLALLGFVACVEAGMVAAASAAPLMPPPTMMQPLRGPWVPRDAQPATVAVPTAGAALRAQVQAKLKSAFDAADTAGSGRLTRAQAAAGGLGYVTQHFDAIDAHHTGAVSFEDVAAFMRQRAAQAANLR